MCSYLIISHLFSVSRTEKQNKTKQWKEDNMYGIWCHQTAISFPQLSVEGGMCGNNCCSGMTRQVQLVQHPIDLCQLEHNSN